MKHQPKKPAWTPDEVRARLAALGERVPDGVRATVLAALRVPSVTVHVAPRRDDEPCAVSISVQVNDPKARLGVELALRLGGFRDPGPPDPEWTRWMWQGD